MQGSVNVWGGVCTRVSVYRSACAHRAVCMCECECMGGCAHRHVNVEECVCTQGYAHES